MTDEQKQEIMRRYNQGMCAMSDAQMAVRAAEQAEGMRNAASDPKDADNLRNFWPHDALADIGPANMPPLTWRQRLTQWLSRFWGK